MHRLDRRHLRWIVESCDWYLTRKCGLGRTISDIEVLIGELDRPDNRALVAGIRNQWGVLEDFYSIDVVYPSRRVLLEHQDKLDQAAQNMKVLAMDALSHVGYGQEPGEDEEDEEG